MADKGHSNGSKFCDQEKVRHGFKRKRQQDKKKTKRLKNKDQDGGQRPFQWKQVL